MSHYSFENLEIWQLARNLQKDLWAIFYLSNFKNYSFQDQIMRAAISISNNIAEWNEKPTSKDKIKFLYIAKWSAAEVRSMIYASYDFWYINDEERKKFLQQTITVSVKIYNFIHHIAKNSG